MNRYETLVKLVRDLNPDHVVEIGTWSGVRAGQFMGVSDCYYTGFDLFEEATSDTDEKELNVKTHVSITEVAHNLNQQGFSKFCLIRGNTHDTLGREEIRPFDFAFIDGGHSEETIRHDLEWVMENITPGGTVILDDFYEPRREGFGCNTIAEEYLGAVLEPDRIKGGKVSLVRVQA